MKHHKFDAVVVGSGTSAWFTITALNEAGRKVAVVDELPYGGTCALRGCQPKKYLVANAEAVASAAHLVGKGIVEKPHTDWSALQWLKNQFLDGKPEAAVKDWKESGVETFHGRATMTGLDEVTVGNDVLQAEHIVLATGASPRRAEIPGGELIKISDDFVEMQELPRRIIFIGGGYISFEFAHVAKRAGAEEVTILHRSTKPLKEFDQDMVKLVIKAGEEEGVRVVLDESPASVEEISDGYKIIGATGAKYEADLVVGAAGRSPNLSVLGDGSGGVESSSEGILVNEYLQSVSNPRVYAIGDVASQGIMLATVADQQGKVAGRNILEGNLETVDYSVVPTAVFTIPNLASVGLTEAQANEQGLDFRVNTGFTKGWPSSKRIGEQHGGYKVLIDNDSDKLVGAHLVRHNAAESINTFALAIKYGVTAKEFSNFMWAYPTMTSDLKYMVG